MKKRVAGIMRIKNEGMFVEGCIESCIDALDELIVVYNDCTDNTAEEVGKMAAKYPDKIRQYEYPYEVEAFNLSREQFERVKAYPEGNPHLFSTYSNFALSKVTADYVVKIDSDQVYFTDTLKYWCDFMRECEPQKMSIKTLAGKIFSSYLSSYRWLSLKSGWVLPIMPSWLLKVAYPAYLSYAKYAFSHDIACMSLSGVNVLETDRMLISMGHESNILLMLSPFNGVGDTVMFKVSDKTYFQKVVMDAYNKEDATSFIVAEEFVHPYPKVTYIGYFWKHIRTMRPGTFEAALKAYEKDPKAFVSVEEFKKKSFKDLIRESPRTIFVLYHQILFNFVYKANKKKLIAELEKNQISKINNAK